MNRREEIGQRLAAIRTRIDELNALRQDDTRRAAVSERTGSAQRQAAASQVAAEQAIAASIRAFRRAAQAHEHAPSSMNEPQQADSATRASTSGEQHVTGQPPQQTYSEKPRMLVDLTRTKR